MESETTQQSRRLTAVGVLNRMVNALKNAVFPKKCLSCGAFFHIEQEQIAYQPFQVLQPVDGSTGICSAEHDINQAPSHDFHNFCFDLFFESFLCSDCLNGFIPVEPPLCLECGIMFQSREGDDRVCGECITHPKEFKMARAPGVYSQNLVGLIHNFKYNGKIQLAKPLGAFLFAAFIHYWDISSIDLIIPVPLHIKKLRKRGFNQTFLLIRDWFRLAEDLNIKLSGIQIEKDLLVRNRWTKPQTGLDRKKRLTNIKNAFRIIDSEKVEKKRVLLVDDVYTTGATVNECAKVLLNAAALKVEVLTLARAV